MTTMCWTASRPRWPLADGVAQLAMRTARTIRTAAGRAARSGTPPCILRKLGATSAGKSRPMLFDGAVGKYAQQFLDGGGSREQPLVRVLGHAVGGAPSALVHLVEGRLPGDQPQILLVGHPEIRHHHPSLVTAEAAGGDSKNSCSAVGDGAYSWRHARQIRRTSRCDMTPMRDEAISDDSICRSRRRGKAAMALLVCSVLRRRWPVWAARKAISAVSWSRISPTMMISGS